MSHLATRNECGEFVGGDRRLRSASYRLRQRLHAASAHDLAPAAFRREGSSRIFFSPVPTLEMNFSFDREKSEACHGD